jgi:two-component system, LytTR family, sensor kinase
MNINKNHLYYWLAYAAFFGVLDYVNYGPNFNIVRTLWILFIDVFLFYALFFGLVHFKKKPVLDLAKSIGIFAASFALLLGFNYIKEWLAKHDGVRLYASNAAYIIDCINMYIKVAFFAIGYYWLARYGTQPKGLTALGGEQAHASLAEAQLALRNAESAAHRAQAQQNVLELENNFLRAQINPHFLYNTLNLFYAQALSSNKNLADGLLTLADIMRYSLETTQGGHLVPLQMEVEHLRRVIAIHQLRFGNSLHIQFTAEGPLGEVKVAPLIFITLLENALKHGAVNASDEAMVLQLLVDDNCIYFSIRNKISEGFKSDGYGVELDNVKKRLAAVYGDQHSFTIEAQGGFYLVEMMVVHTAVMDDNETGVEN